METKGRREREDTSKDGFLKIGETINTFEQRREGGRGGRVAFVVGGDQKDNWKHQRTIG